MSLRIGYLGPEGTFSSLAFKQFIAQYPNDNYVGMSANSLFDLFVWLRESKCDQIIVPIENSVEGSVVATLDLLVENQPFKIQGEIVLKIEQCLIGVQEVPLDSIRLIISHPQALAQCQKFIYSQLSRSKTFPISSTAAAVQFLLDHEVFEEIPISQIAAIGSRNLAHMHHLQIIKESIQDVESNATCFVVIGPLLVSPTGKDKTSLVFSPHRDKPGGLYEILGAFAQNKINLTKITSRPMKTVLGEYLFFIDFEGHQLDAHVQQTLRQIQEKTSFFRNLGSYPMG